MQMFDASDSELDEVLPLVEDAWNYFPHRALWRALPGRTNVGKHGYNKDPPPKYVKRATAILNAISRPQITNCQYVGRNLNCTMF